MSSDAQFWVIALLLVAIMILLGITVQRLTSLLALVRSRGGRLD
jgi:hypothetical protein